MNEAGFDYETSGQRTETNTSEQPDPASRQWAETYGFGVTTLAFSQEQVGQHLTGFNDNTPNPTATTLNAAEANLAIYEQLDTEAKSEYLQALTGDPRVPETVTETIYSPGPNATGCIGELQNRTALQNAFYTEFGDQLDTIRAELNADPRITDHNTLTNACVTAKGLRYTPPDRLYHRWSEDLQAIQDSLDFTTVAGAGARPHLTATAKAQLLTIQAEEADLAIAIHDCGADPATTNTLYTEVAHDLETRFIDNNRDRLDDFKEEHSLD